MRKVISFCLLTLIVLNASAQEGVISENAQLGVEVPDFDIQILTNEGSVVTNIRNYRGKVVILEFWATYCGPCLPAMDHLAEVRNNFTNELEVFAITDEPRSKVVNFLNNRPASLLVALDDDKTLNRLFYHQFMPHTVVIGPDGFVKAITSPDQITKELIYLAINGVDLMVKTKAEFATNDFNDAALVQYSSTEDNSIYKVVISPQVDGIQSQINKKAPNEYEFTNCTVPMMYQALYQTTLKEADGRACLEVTQQTKYLLEENYQYCLKLKVPEKQESNIGLIGMRHLEEVFSIRPQNEMRSRNVYSLMISEPGSLVADSLTTAPEGNMSLKDFISLLWETRLVDKPIINDSGLPDDTIMSIEIPTQVYEVGERLASIGMRLEPKIKETSCLVLHKDVPSP
ncbi:MAG: TlpA family protein disulfide reductase [Spirosomaceae bacterium]|nr:TlpA family protein disulfide reductase [Spirosomataceae bacterium]